MSEFLWPLRKAPVTLSTRQGQGASVELPGDCAIEPGLTRGRLRAGKGWPEEHVPGAQQGLARSALLAAGTDCQRH